MHRIGLTIKVTRKYSISLLFLMVGVVLLVVGVVLLVVGVVLLVVGWLQYC